MALTEERPPGDPVPQYEPGTMTVFEHLAELRNRLLVCVAAVVVTTVIAFFFYDRAISFMRSPYCHYIAVHKSKSGLGCSLYITGPLEGFTTRLKISLYGGLGLAAPVWLWELWRFITPGLKSNERRYVVPFTAAATVLFGLGVATAILVFPKALTWLINIGGKGIVPLFSPTRYFTLYVAMCLAFGAIFLYPLVLVSLELTGVVPSAKWRHWRRAAIVVIAGVAAVITPSSDPFSFLAMAVPMYIFYEGSILLGRLLGK